MKPRKPYTSRNNYDPFIDYHSKTISGHSLEQLTERFGLPCHILFQDKIEENICSYLKVFRELYPKGEIRYAAKSYCSPEVLRIMNDLGAGVDVCSENELAVARIAKIPASKIVVNGNAKSDQLLEEAMDQKLLIIIDSIYEYEQIIQLAKLKQLKDPVNCLIRISGFELNSETDECIHTSGSWTKFGIPYDLAHALLIKSFQEECIEIIGFHVHIGSQIASYEPYAYVFQRILQLADVMEKNNRAIRVIDMGGGFPISYLNEEEWSSFTYHIEKNNRNKADTNCFIWNNPTGDYNITEKFYSKHPKYHMLKKILTHRLLFRDKVLPISEILRRIGEPALLIEPGRSVVGDAGITISKVNGVKKVCQNNLIVLEMGAVNYAGSVIHNLVNNWALFEPDMDEGVSLFQGFICGNLCYNGDMISRYKVTLNRQPERGDYLITYDTGSTESHFFASNANLFPIPSRLLLKGKGEICIVKKRQELSEILYE